MAVPKRFLHSVCGFVLQYPLVWWQVIKFSSYFCRFDQGADIRSGLSVQYQRPDAAQTVSILPSYVLESEFGRFAKVLVL